MPEYQAMYLALLNGLEDAVNCLKRAQQACEALYLEGDAKLSVLKPPEHAKTADQEATF